MRFPQGETEFRLLEAAPLVGDILKRGNDEWRVSSVATDTYGQTAVTLEPGSGKAKPREG